MTLSLDHEVGEDEARDIARKYIAKTLAKDWRFYHTVTRNLEKVTNDLLFVYQEKIDANSISPLR